MSLSRLSRVCRALAAVTLAALLAPTGRAAAQPQDLFPDAGWFFFDFAGTGPVANPADGFVLSLATPGTLRVVDFGVVGDVFTLALAGAASHTLTTSPILPGTDGLDSGVLDGDEAWADGRLSRGQLLLAPGDYTIAIAVSQTAAGTSGGVGLISVTSTPEPATLGLVAGGLAALVRRRRVPATRSRRTPRPRDATR
jgi:hypothetical protein